MSPVLAYLDPASGTLIVSAIVGGFAAIAMLFRKFWFRIKSVFTGTEPTEPVTADAPADEA